MSHPTVAQRYSRHAVAPLLVAMFMMTATLLAETPPKRWWLDEPVRLFQTNVAETASTMDAKRLVNQIADFSANTLLFNMGGIVAQYPTRVPFHYVSQHMPPGRDLFGEILDHAHSRGIRVIGRFDLSKTQKPVYDAHPEWFFKRVNGGPALYNGTYLACINGDYYHVHGMKILTEALERYEVDGLFFNMFGNPGEDYSNVPIGACQCGACQTRFREQYGRELPTDWADPNYREFMAESTRNTAEKIAALIHRLRPNAAFLTYLEEHTDVIMEESDASVSRPLPLWPYMSSDNVNRLRTAEPEKAVFNMSMSSVDYPWRFVTVPQGEVRLRLYQNIAHGGALAFSVVGTPDQEDRRAMIAAKPIFDWHAQHEELYVGQENAARVLLLTAGPQDSYRGFFRLLSEQHIPFAATGNMAWATANAARFDLIIAPHGATSEIEPYVRAGGRLLVAGPVPPPDKFSIAKVSAQRSAQAAWRIHHDATLPSLQDTNLLFLDGAYVELEPSTGAPLLTLIPPAMFGPPEKVWVDKQETTIPGLVLARHGHGRVAYIPWDVGALYYRHSSEGHAGLMVDVIDQLLPRGRQVKSNAHPLVEITVMRQPQHKRTLVHLVNVSGHSSTAFFSPIEMHDILVELDEPFTHARAVRLNQPLTLDTHDKSSKFTLPRLESYEVVVLE